MTSKKQKESNKENRSKEKPVSLAPLSVEEALGDLLRVRPQPKPAKEEGTKKK